ncbi:MAG: hypothetical protein ACTHMG_09245 [Sphingomonas sp.]
MSVFSGQLYVFDQAAGHATDMLAAEAKEAGRGDVVKHLAG